MYVNIYGGVGVRGARAPSFVFAVKGIVDFAFGLS